MMRFTYNLRVIRRSSIGLGLAVVSLLCLISVLAPWAAPYDPIAQNLPKRTQPPRLDHLLGTDHLGRDVLSRIVWGTRLSLLSAFAAVTLALSVGVSLGLLSGYRGGLLDTVIMRFVDVMLAFPLYLIALIVVAILGPSLVNSVIAIAVGSLASFARLGRGETLAMRSRDFVEAARALGAKSLRIMYRHVLPNILGPLVVAASLRLGQAILVEASLSFLGLGPSPPTPAWGLMVSDGLRVIRSAWWASTFPGIAIIISVLGFNLLGDGIRDAMDPRLR
jgi:peptide/nickel transport system permease protein